MMMTNRPTSTARRTVVCLTLAAVAIAACAPKKGADRFLGTFSWRQAFGYQAVAFEKNGKAKYISTAPDEGNDDSTETKARPSTYRISGDTAFLVVDWGHPSEGNDTLYMLLRGDSLIMMNEVLGGNPVFLRDK